MRAAPPRGVQLGDAADRVRYVGSPEHKNYPSFAGHPAPRADASLCDPNFADSQSELTDMLRDAIRRGDVGAPWEGGLPRYVWLLRDGQAYEARLVNRGNGDYKGYPLLADEWPEGIDADAG